MYGGSIDSFTIDGSTLTAAVVVGSGGTYNMHGGAIKNNRNYTSAYSGGGVLLYTWNGDPKAVMTMSEGAEISGNTSYAGGGGINLIGNTDFRMTGGTISGNKAWGGHGGGVCVTGAPKGINPKDDITAFVMDGGTISGNESANCGGGIYVNSSDVVLNGGRIEKNKAHQHGGGIYVSQPPYELHLYHALITDNTASALGGGLWFCPTGKATLAVNEGSAVFGNRAQGEKSAGDDFASVGKGEGNVTLADRMLGGGAVEWYKDGAVRRANTPGTTSEWMETGEADSSVPRFNPSNPGQRIMNINSNEGFALKSVTSEAARKLAASQAKLVISGNTAQRGGGIGSNGTVVIGKPNGEYTLKVIKKWSEDTPAESKQDLTVYLKIGDYMLDSVQLTSENNWTAEFTQLPNPNSLDGLKYAVVEDPVPDFFTPVYHQAVIKDGTMTIEVENDFSEPVIEVPQTGDHSQLLLWIALLFVSGGLMAAGAYSKTKRSVK